MATYEELDSLANDPTLLARCRHAVVESAFAMSETETDVVKLTKRDRRWARAVLSRPHSEAAKALRYILATNSRKEVQVIRDLTDGKLQNTVEKIIPTLVAALSGE